MYNTILQITMSPEQLAELIDERFAIALANYSPPIPKGADLPELLTRKQTAEFLQVSLTTLNDWAKDTPDRCAILVPQKVNGQVRYHKNKVLDAVKEKRRFKS